MTKTMLKEGQHPLRSVPAHHAAGNPEFVAGLQGFWRFHAGSGQPVTVQAFTSCSYVTPIVSLYGQIFALIQVNQLRTLPNGNCQSIPIFICLRSFMD